MTCGIYCIENLISGKKYIGKAINIENRWIRHKKDLRAKSHCNVHFQNSWDKYGGENFIFRIIEVCEENFLSEKEIFWIKKYNTKNIEHGYNKTNGGDGSTGFTHSENTKIKMRNLKNGKNHWNYGKHLSEETKIKISESNTGRECSEEAKKKISESNIGRTHSEEAKKKISEFNKGKHLSDEQKKKISESEKGKVVSSETRKKISESGKRYWEKRRLENGR